MRILFVCTGNICRSPTAEAIFVKKAAAAGLEAIADSAGTSSEEAGNPPDRRSVEAAVKRGYTLPKRPARCVRVEDFQNYDLLIAMQSRHLQALLRLAPPGKEAAVHRLMDFAIEPETLEVPDPWYGDRQGFDRVFDLIEAGVDGLIARLKAGEVQP